jgi:hypothetical protein
MAYYIFLKSLRTLEEFRKNPRVKIPPKSPSTNFQSLGKFKIPIFNSETLFLAFGPFGLWPSPPTGRAIPAGRNRPGRPIQPARRSRLRGKYVFPLGSRLPEPAASPSSLCQPGPKCQIHPLPRAGRPRSEIPRVAAPRLGCPRAFTTLPHHSPPLIPFNPSLNAFNGPSVDQCTGLTIGK